MLLSALAPVARSSRGQSKNSYFTFENLNMFKFLYNLLPFFAHLLLQITYSFLNRSAQLKARHCFNLWNNALSKKNCPEAATALYKHNSHYGTLVPTLSNTVRHTEAGIRAYFDYFCAKLPTGKIDEIYAQNQAGGIVTAGGLYTFTFSDGKTPTAPARFTYAFTKDCKILEHHSSLLPEA
jgi:hypothetical protein